MIQKLDSVFVSQDGNSFEPVMNHRFVATISRCPDSLWIPEDLWFLVRRINPGGRSVDLESYNYLNKIIQYPSRKGACMSSTVTLGLFSGRKAQAYDFMKKWYNLVYTESNGGESAVGVLTQDGTSVGGASGVNGNIRVDLLNPDNSKAFAVTMVDCWPQNVRLIDLDMDSGDQIAQMEYTFVVNDWQFEEA